MTFDPASYFAYCTQADVENVYHPSNVSKWAIMDGTDPDTPEGIALIAERISMAIAIKSQYINDRLRGGPYALPITSPGAALTMLSLCADLAGVYLYESRGAQDINAETGQPEHRYAYKVRAAERLLDEIRGGKVRLDAELAPGHGTNSPFTSITPRRRNHLTAGIVSHDAMLP